MAKSKSKSTTKRGRPMNTEIMIHAIELARAEAENANADAAIASIEQAKAEQATRTALATAKAADFARVEAEGKANQARAFASNINMAAEVCREMNRHLRFQARETRNAMNHAIDDLESGRLTIADFCNVARAWTMTGGDA